MYAQVIFLDGLDCAKCGRAVFPHGRPTVGQVVDRITGLATIIPDANAEEAKTHSLEASCVCGASVRIPLDGFHYRIERQQTAPVVVDPIYIV